VDCCLRNRQNREASHIRCRKSWSSVPYIEGRVSSVHCDICNMQKETLWEKSFYSLLEESTFHICCTVRRQVFN
jgi:hypothetical protein